MSYDISLYDADFLERAIREGLGDWTSSPMVGEAAAATFRQALQEAGFHTTPHDPSFVDFLRSLGKTPSEEWLREDDEIVAQASLFPGSFVLAIPFTPCAMPSIELCRSIARAVAADTGLAVHDPQSHG